MAQRDESLGLYINSDGPNVGGNYERTGTLNLNISGGNANDPIKYSLDGLKHFNNWDAGLNSLDSTNTERFEYSGATNYVDYNFNAAKIKIVDEIAAISYPEFTDISKVVWQHENGGLYQARGCRTYASYDTYSTGCDPVFRGGFLPLVNKKGLNDSNIDGYYNNLVILVEYDGYYADSPNTMGFNAALVGKKEMFVYSPSPTDDPGKYYFYPGLTNSFPILNSRHSNIILDYTDFGTNPSARLTETQVVEDYDNLVNYSPSYQALPYELKEIYYNNTYPQTSILDISVNFAFLGYSKVSLMKYSVAQKCGKVDIFHRKHGQVTAISNSSVATSVAHDLQNGDIIKITGAVGSDLNGIKYIQKNSSDSFTIYDDNVFLTRTSVADLNTGKSLIKWVLIGSIYDNSRQGWSFKKSIISPNGQNGYSHSGSYGTDNNIGLPAEFDGLETFGQIAELDISYSSLFETASDPYDSILPVRNRYSRLDALWAGPQHYVNDYRFGSDIDLKKIAGEYRLVVGEMGPDQIVDFINPIVDLPNVSPYGKVHDFTLSLDVNKVLTVNLNNTIKASTGSSGIAVPPEMYAPCSDTGYIFYVPTDSMTRIDTAISQSYNSLDQEYTCSLYALDDEYLTDSYWLGALLYHLPDRFNTSSDNGYYSDYALDYLIDGIPMDTYYDFYPYVDNFGKSVALDYSNGKILLLVGSTTKTDIVTTADSTSCGPVHVFDITGSVASVQKINSFNDVVTPSGKYGPQADRARRFAQCMKAVDGFVAIGKSKPYEVQDIYQEFSDVSHILLYRFNGTVYEFHSSVSNACNYTYYGYGTLLPGYKEAVLRDRLEEATTTSLRYVFPSDRFGDYFDFTGGVIATNVFDINNEFGLPHEDRTYPDVQCDYIQVYELNSDRWEFMGKLSATLDSSNAKYDYESFLFPNNYFSLRSLGNKTYVNSLNDAVTWDIDLSNAFVIADDRIILKDPLGYVIFKRNWAPKTVATAPPVVELFEYFRYQEHFLGTDYGILSHKKFSKLYKYEETADLLFVNDNSTNKNESIVPVHFISVPASLQVNSVSFYVEFIGDPSNVKMLLYKNDPRLTVDINYDYKYMINGYEVYPEYPGDMFTVNKNSDGNKIFYSGALDGDIYHLTTPAIDTPLAKAILPTSIDGSVARFDLSLSDIAIYKVTGSAIQNTERSIEEGVYEPHKTLELYDISKSTYNSEITIEDTLIVGFTFTNVEDTNYYMAPYFGASVTNANTIQGITAFTNQVYTSETLPRRYDCISDRISNFTTLTTQYSDGKEKYKNPVMGIGPSLVSSATSDNPNSFVKSYQLFTYESYEQEEALRSLDVNQLDYASLYMHSNETASKNLNLLFLESLPSSGSANLYINNLGKINNIELYLESSSFGTGVLPLNMMADAPVSSSLGLTLANYLVGATGTMNLTMYNSNLENNMPLTMQAPIPTPVTGDSTLYMYGGLDNNSYFNENTKTLYMSGTVNGYSDNVMQLVLKVDDSFSLESQAPLFINNYNTIVPLSGTADLFMYNTDTQEINWINKNTSTVLYLNASPYSTTGVMPLYLSRKGSNGEEEVERIVSLHMNNVQSTGVTNLFLDSAGGVSNSVNLFLPIGTGNKTGSMDTFIRGYEDE